MFPKKITADQIGAIIARTFKGKSQIGKMIGVLASLPQVAVVRQFLYTSVPLRKDNDVLLVMNLSHMSFLTIQRKVFAPRT